MMETASCRWTADRPGRIAHATLLICVQAFGFFVIGPALLAPSILGDADPFQGAPAAIGLFATLSVVDVIGLIGYGLLRVGRIDLSTLGWRFPLHVEDLLRGCLGGGACTLVVCLVWISLGHERNVAAFAAQIATFSVSQRVLFALLGLQSAFVEETLFRGYLQPAFIARWGTVAGILMTAAVFALYHLNPRPYALAAKFAFGIIFGVLKGRDRSLFAPAVAHALLWNIVGTT
jgi:hypothetical protein